MLKSILEHGETVIEDASVLFTDSKLTGTRDVSPGAQTFPVTSFFSEKSPHDSGIFHLAGADLDLPTLSSRIGILGEIIEKLQFNSVVATFEKLEGGELEDHIVNQSLRIELAKPDINTMWFRRFAAIIADDFVKLKEEFDKIKLDSQKFLSEVLTVKLNHVPEVALTPTAVVVTMEAFDYAKACEKLNFASEGHSSLAATLFYQKLPEILRHRLILVNLGDGETNPVRSDYHLWVSKRHEKLHSLFNVVRGLLNRDSYVDFAEEFAKISDPHDYHSHQRLAAKAMRYIFDIARSEVLSYYSCYFEDDLDDASIFFNNFECMDEQLEMYLEKSCIEGEEAEQIKDIYRVEKTNFKLNFLDYTKLVREAYLSAGPVSDRNNVDAAILLIPIEDVEVLKQYVSAPRLTPNPELPISRTG